MSSSSANGEGPCSVCSAPGRACARCRVDFYCGKDHQTLDWPRHKLGCSFLEARYDALTGRHLVAAKAIPGGTVLMREAPLVSFPTSWNIPDNGALFTMCVGCGVERGGALAADMARCKSCGWPVCGAACSQRQEHRAECQAFQRAGFKLKAGDAASPGATKLDALTALRVALAFEDEKVGARLRSLPGRLPDLEAAVKDAGTYQQLVREAHEAFAARLRRASNWLRGEARLHWLPAEDLQRGLAVALQHGMEGASGSEFHLVGGVFAGLSLVGHSCLPTAWRYPVHRDLLDMQLVATRDVAKGERLTTAFIRDPLNPALGCETERRRTGLVAMLGAVCRCELCEDPSQRGLRLASWLCACWQHHECRALVTVLEGGRWRCESCLCEGVTSAQDGEQFMAGMLDAMVAGCVGGGKAMLRGQELDGAMGQGLPLLLEEHFRNLVAAGNTSVDEWEEFIADALPPSGPLHPTHHLVLRAKRQILCPDKGGAEGDIVNLKLRIPSSVDEARRYASHGRDLLRAVELLRPGVNHYRADLLRQLVVLATLRMGRFAALPPRQQAACKAEWKAIVQDLAEYLQTLKKISVSPFEKETLPSMISQKNMLLARLNPVLKKDTVDLQLI